MKSGPTNLRLAHGLLEFPVFLPDATFGIVRSVDLVDLANCQIMAVVMNTFHLMQRPGSSTIQSLGGLHQLSGWDKPIVTDSGGFQAYSLIHQNPKFGYLTDKGLVFQPEGSDRKLQLTPEKCIQLQMGYGSDLVICLDDCTHVDASHSEQLEAVRRTINWAKRGKVEYLRLVDQKKLSEEDRPRLFAVIQGGGEFELRKICAEALLEIGFDGFGYGGWPLDKEGNLVVEILSYTRNLIPHEFPMHALGIGHPQNLVTCNDLGYGLFDCAMPTRDARHGRLYSFTTAAEGKDAGLHGKWLAYLYINDEKHIKADRPISDDCDCLVCQRYSRGFLHHIFKLNDTLFFRLATIHNLRFMTQLTDRLRQRGLQKSPFCDV